MPWSCSICDTFLAVTFQQLLSHIGRCHRNDPNFHCVCGINGCTRTFRKYFSWRKHIFRDHKHINNEHEEEDVDQFNPDPCDNDAGQPQINDHEDKKRQEALYLLKLQEDCRLPITMVDSVLANTASIVENNVTNLQNEIKSCIQNAGIEVNTVPGLETLLSEDNSNKRIFEDFDTNKKRVVYYKENFGLKVTTLTYFYKLYYKTGTQAHDKPMLP